MDRHDNFGRAPWCEDELNLLYAGIDAKLSSSEISETLWEAGFQRTRNAVMGKHERLYKAGKIGPLARSDPDRLSPRAKVIIELADAFPEASIMELAAAVEAEFRSVLKIFKKHVLGPRAVGDESELDNPAVVERRIRMRKILMREEAAA